MKLGKLCILCTDQKILQNKSIKLWSTLFKIWKQFFLNIKDSKTSELHRFKLDLTDNLNLKDPKKNMALTNLNICYTCENIKWEYQNNKFKISASTWDDVFELPDGSYSIAGIEDYFEFII